MMYEPYERKPRREKRRDRQRRKRSLLVPLLQLALLLISLGVVAGLALYLLPAGLFAIEPETKCAHNAYTNMHVLFLIPKI